MPSFSIFKLSEEQTDLFNFNSEGNIDLDNLIGQILENFTTPIVDGRITGSGFINPNIVESTISKIDDTMLNYFKYFVDNQDDNYRALHATVTGAGSLGYYNEVFLSEGGQLTSNRRQHEFFSKADIILTESGILIIYFENTAAEKIKAQIKTLFENLGFLVTTFRISPPLLKNLRDVYDWTEVKLERIKNEEDNTKKVAYEVDISNQEDASIIDAIYKDKGIMTQITLHLPFTSQFSTVDKQAFYLKLYNVENRGSLNLAEFSGNHEHMKDFVLFITNLLLNKNIDSTN